MEEIQKPIQKKILHAGKKIGNFNLNLHLQSSNNVEISQT
jgi:hypothetical protein